MKKIYTALTILILFILLLGYAGVKAVSSWFDSHEVTFNQIVEIRVNKPFEIKAREPQVKEVVLDYPADLINTPIKEYICDKFGPLDCKVALAIVQAESGFNEQAINVNKNGSVDLGCWQINFPTHNKTITPQDALDCHKATDWAYEKFKRDGNFNAWVSFVNKSYLGKL